MGSRAKIAVFISGGGSNLQALIDASETGKLSGEIVLVISGHDNAYGLERAFNAKEPVLLDVIMDRDVGVPTDGHWDILDIFQY